MYSNMLHTKRSIAVGDGGVWSEKALTDRRCCSQTSDHGGYGENEPQFLNALGSRMSEPGEATHFEERWLSNLADGKRIIGAERFEPPLNLKTCK